MVKKNPKYKKNKKNGGIIPAILDERVLAVPIGCGECIECRKQNSYGQITNYVNEKTVNYIIKYITKIDEQHKTYQPKILCSKGIGAGYMKRSDWENAKFKGK